MSFKAKYVQQGDMIDHTPGSAVPAGGVVVIGTSLICIATSPIAAGALGALATRGVFLGAVDAEAGFDEGDDVYWDADGTPEDDTYGAALSGCFTDDSSLGPWCGKALANAANGRVLFYLNSRDSAVTLARSAIVQQDLVPYPIDLTSLRVWNARHTNLPGTAADDDMALVTGTFGTHAPTLQGVDFGGTTTDEKGAFSFQLPPEYVAGQTITLRVRGAMLTTVSDGTATVDAEVHKRDRDGAVGADLCATAAQSINSLTPADKDFTITPTGLAPGDTLEVRLSFGGSDTGNAGVMIPEISAVEMLLDIKG